MEIENLIERLQNWDGIKPDREIDCAIEGLKALQAENDRLQAELEKEEEARKKQADILYELRGQKYEQTTAIDQLRAENDRFKRERDAVLKSFPYMCNSCRYHTMFYNGYAPVYSCTNPDGHCLNNYDKWQWRGPKEE